MFSFAYRSIQTAFFKMALVIPLLGLAAQNAAAAVTLSPSAPLNPDYSVATGEEEIPMAIGSDGGNMYVSIWKVGSEFRVARSLDGGTTWQDELTLTVPPLDGGSLGTPSFSSFQVAYTGSSWVLFAEASFGGWDFYQDWHYTSTSLDGVHWSPFHLKFESFNFFNGFGDGDMAADRNGTVIVVVRDTVFRSTDSGVNWTSATLTTADGATDQRQMQVTYGGGNKWYIATAGTSRASTKPLAIKTFYTSTDGGQSWTSKDITNSVGNVYDMAAYGNTVVISNWPNLNTTTDDGATWTGTVSGGQPGGYVTVDATGHFVAWRNFQSVTSANPVAGWGPAINLDAPPGYSLGGNYRTYIAAGANGTFILLRPLQQDASWFPGYDFEVFSQSSSDFANSWSAPRQVNLSGLDDIRFVSDQYLKIVAGENGVVLAGWTASVPNTFDHVLKMSRSTDGGLTWAPPNTINSRSAGLLCYAGAGRWLAAWAQGPHPDWGGYSISDDNGITWSGEQIFFGDVAGGSGTGTLVKGQHMASTPMTYGLARMARDAYVWEEPTIVEFRPVSIQHTFGNNWFALAEGGTVYTSGDDGRSWYPSPLTENVPPANSVIAVDAQGTALAVYRTETGVYRQFAMWASRSVDNGQKWTKPVFVGSYSEDLGYSVTPRVYADVTSISPGVWAVAHGGLVAGSLYDSVWVSVSQTNGSSWSPPVSPAAGPHEKLYDRQNPTVASSGGNIILGWDNDSDVHYSTGQFNRAAAADWQLYD